MRTGKELYAHNIDDFNNFEYRYKNVNINDYIDAKLGDKILFCGRYYTLRQRFNNDYNIYKIFVGTEDNNGNYRVREINIKDLVYGYFNNITCIPEELYVSFINGNVLDTRIENLKLIDRITKDNIFDWNFKYKNVDNNTISILEKAKPGDIIPLFDRNYSVYISDNGYLKITINIRDNKKSKTITFGVHRLVYEYYNKCILGPNDHVHHKDENKQNNAVNNLQGLSKRDHVRHHGIELSKPVINIMTNEIYSSISEAEEYTGLRISEYCNGITVNCFNSNKFMFLEDYNNFPDKVNEKRNNLKNYKGYDENIVLPTIYDKITEESYKDYNFRYNNVNIEDYYNVKVGQKVYYCGSFYTVQNNFRKKYNPFITLFLLNHLKVPLKRLIYVYHHSEMISIDKNEYLIDNISDNIFDNDINNLKIRYKNNINMIDILNEYNNDVDKDIHDYDDIIFINEEEYIINNNIMYSVGDLKFMNEFFPEFCEFKDI